METLLRKYLWAVDGLIVVLCAVFLARASATVIGGKMVISGGAAGSWQMTNLAPKMVQGDFKPGFKVWHQEKDLRHALDLARENHVPLPGTALVSQLFAALQNEGLGEEGTQALVKALEKLGNVKVGE